MKRRTFLRSAVAGGVLGTAGCIGGGGKVVTNLQRDISVAPHSAWIKQIPDVSDPGGAISYIARGEAPFDVYFFVGRDAVKRYQSYIRIEQQEGAAAGMSPDLPTGHADITRTATRVGQDMYKATSVDDGGRRPLEEPGPYFFVLDNTNYPAAGGAYIGDNARDRSIFVDLTVTKKRFGL
jgi:hypothetical protein